MFMLIRQIIDIEGDFKKCFSLRRLIGLESRVITPCLPATSSLKKVINFRGRWCKAPLRRPINTPMHNLPKRSRVRVFIKFLQLLISKNCVFCILFF